MRLGWDYFVEKQAKGWSRGTKVVLPSSVVVDKSRIEKRVMLRLAASMQHTLGAACRIAAPVLARQTGACQISGLYASVRLIQWTGRIRVIALVAIKKARSRPNASDEPPLLPQDTRVRVSALGAARCPNLVGREGVVVGSGRGRYRSTVRVMFDGFKSPTALHNTYIEAVIEQGSSDHGWIGRY